MIFYLGTHQPHWLATMDVPFCVSYNRLKRRRSPHKPAVVPWILDSGAYSQLDKPPHRFAESPALYAKAVRRYADELGNMLWAAPQDWMCEPHIRAHTGYTVEDHQRLTINSYEDLLDEGVPVIPVVQGYTLAEYVGCVEMYAARGHHLDRLPVVGVGSICRREATQEIADVLCTLAGAGLRLHGFGAKKAALRRCSHLLVSADSLAWSWGARYGRPMDGCTHKSCANCPRYALRWRDEVLAEALRPEQTWMALN